MAGIKVHENQGTGDRLVEIDFPIPPQSPTPRLTDAERRAEQDRVRAEAPNADEFWIFGFGSLMWRPGLKVAHREPATLQGYKRRFEIWSTVGRGTLVQPGLGCCLVGCPPCRAQRRERSRPRQQVAQACGALAQAAPPVAPEAMKARWLRPLMARRIGRESMDTQAACRTYNILASEGRNVVAALLLE